jgi:hypothetical protein
MMASPAVAKIACRIRKYCGSRKVVVASTTLEE